MNQVGCRVVYTRELGGQAHGSSKGALDTGQASARFHLAREPLTRDTFRKNQFVEDRVIAGELTVELLVIRRIPQVDRRHKIEGLSLRGLHFDDAGL